MSEILDLEDDFPNGKDVDSEVDFFYRQVIDQQKRIRYSKGHGDGFAAGVWMVLLTEFVLACVFAIGYAVASWV